MKSLLILITTFASLHGTPNTGYNNGSVTYSSPANLRVDSLKNLLAGALSGKDNPTDTVTINRINKLASEFIDINADTALYYAKIGIDRSLAIGYKKGIADGMEATGSVYSMKGDLNKAYKNLNGARLLYIKIKDNHSLGRNYIEFGRMYNNTANYPLASKYFQQALDIFNKIKDDPGVADAYHNIGMVADNIGKSTSALDNYFKSLSLDLKLHDNGQTARNYNNIGVIMQEMEIYPKSMEYFKRAIKIWEQSKNIQGVSTAYENIGEILMSEKKYDDALVYFARSMKYTKQLDDKNGLSSLCADFGLCYAYLKQYSIAVNYLQQALKISTDAHIDFNKAYVYVDLATVYNLEKDYQNGFKYGKLAKDLADKLGSLGIRSQAALQLSDALGGLNKFSEAYEMRKQYDDLKDSLKSDESVQKLTSFSLEANFKEKQSLLAEEHQRKDELYQQKIQRQGLISIIFFIIILGMIAILIVYYRAKLKQQKINTILEDKNYEVLQQKADINSQAQKLNELNTLKDRLISILAHDLRAPLSTLRGLFGLLEDDTISHEQFLSMIPQALKKLEYTSDFLDTLLFWINSQMENFDSSTKAFNVNEIISYEVSNYSDQAAGKGIKLKAQVSETLEVNADPNSIRIVIRNLITNAIKFSRANDSITISANVQDDGYVLLSIKDTGVGMNEKQLNKLFKSKVDSGTGTNNESGTGMGLLFCKDLIEKCNGRIWVQSEEGWGTEFFFTLPLAHVKEAETDLHPALA
ncbi:MAG TPA: tetratricopeptide repeat protein [Mucilaginibacter sp.]|nr:tetratricopeptide repeat protein [Mucilaginibacter sp.]